MESTQLNKLRELVKFSSIFKDDRIIRKRLSSLYVKILKRQSALSVPYHKTFSWKDLPLVLN